MTPSPTALTISSRPVRLPVAREAPRVLRDRSSVGGADAETVLQPLVGMNDHPVTGGESRVDLYVADPATRDQHRAQPEGIHAEDPTSCVPARSPYPPSWERRGRVPPALAVYFELAPRRPNVSAPLTPTLDAVRSVSVTKVMSVWMPSETLGAT